MKNESEVRAEFLSHLEIEDRMAKASIVYLPLGAIEFHGPHLPTGLDGLTAHGVCVAAAKVTGGVVLPTIYQGTGGEHSNYPWTLMMPTGNGLGENLQAMLGRLEELGVESAVVLSGHFADEQRALLKELAASWAADQSKKMRLTTRSMADCEEAPVAPDHAGVFESLLLAALHPDLVHVNKLPEAATNPSVDPGDNPFGSHRHEKDHALWGVFGPDPRAIDLKDSAALLDALVSWLAKLATSGKK